MKLKGAGNAIRKGKENAVGCSVRRNAEDVRVFSRTFDRSFNVTWLRDHCKCPQCVDASSGQKLRSVGSAATASTPVAPPHTEGNFLVVPLADHTARVPVTDLGVIITSKVKHPGRMLPADEERKRGVSFLSVPKIAHRQFMNDALARAWALRTVHSAGLVIVEGVPRKSESVISVAERIAPILPTFYGNVWNVQNAGETAENIAYTNRELSWHQDLLYFESPPGLQFLNCLKQAEFGGETLFLDAVQAAEEFEKKFPEEFQLLSKFNFTYRYSNSHISLSQKRPLFSLATDRFSHRRVFWAPHFLGNLSLHRDVRKHYEAFATWESHLRQCPHLSFKLAPGQCAIFDNWRLLHSRKSFVGTRHLQGCYVSRDAFRTALFEESVRNCDLDIFTEQELAKD